VTDPARKTVNFVCFFCVFYLTSVVATQYLIKVFTVFDFQIWYGSHLRQIFQMSEDVADNFVSELVRGN